MLTMIAKLLQAAPNRQRRRPVNPDPALNQLLHPAAACTQQFKNLLLAQEQILLFQISTFWRRWNISPWVHHHHHLLLLLLCPSWQKMRFRALFACCQSTPSFCKVSLIGNIRPSKVSCGVEENIIIFIIKYRKFSSTQRNAIRSLI